MADPYNNRNRAYSSSNNNNTPPPPASASSSSTYSRANRPPQPPSILTRTQSFDLGDDATGYSQNDSLARRQSTILTPFSDEQFYDLYASPQQPRQQNNSSMSERPQSPGGGGFFAVGNGIPTPYSPGFDVNNNAPYPTTSGYNGAQQYGQQPQPYNPAAYHPQRHASSAGNTSYAPQSAYDNRLQRHGSAGAFSPTAGSYDPSQYNTTPYPSSYRAPVPPPPPQQQSVQMPAVAPQSRYGYQPAQQRQQYNPNTHSYISSPTQQYSPGFPPIPSQSAPPHNGYQPPPPPPPPHPPGSPGYITTPYPSTHSPSQSSLSYSSSQRTYQSRQDAMYHSGSDSDVSGANDADAPHHPLPSPPRDPKYQSIPPPVLPSHNQQMMRQQSLSRPLPQVPDGEYGDENDLYGEVEGALYGMGSAAQSEGDAPHRGLQRNGTNGRLDPRIESVYDYYSDSDPEGNAGLAMMRLDEELAERRGSAMSTLPPPPEVPPSMDQEDSDQEWPVDIDMYGAGAFGGYYGGFGKDVDNSLPLPPPPLVPAKEGQGPASEDMTDDEKFELQKQLYAIPDDVDVHPFPQFHTEAEDREFEPVMTKSDTWGTGGLAAPAEVAHMAQKLAKRMSFDEGDEAFDRSGSGSPAKDSDDDIPELFYHPPPSSNSPVSSRPLPSPPTHDYNPELRPAGSAPLPYPTQMYGSQPNSARNSYGSYGSSGSPSLLGNMSLGSQQTYIPRTGSLNSPPSAPVANAPVRSKTDGRVHPKLNRASMVIPAAQDLTPGDLPAIPVTRKFDPKKLSTRDFRRCTAPWALSSISAWLKVMTEGEQDLKEAGVADAVAALFTHYVPTMNVADAETLAARVVDGMLKEKNLVEEEEWVKFGPGEVSGVIYQITGNGCYAPRLHNQDSPARCYAHHCARTLRKISLPQGGVEPNQVKEDWATYWKIKKEDMVDVHKKEVERQNNLHEIVQTEEEFMEHMKILKLVYRDQIAAANPSIIKPSKLDAFVKEVFGMSDAVRKVSEEHLLPQLKFRQREQGPWIMGFSDIFREWIRKAKVAYLDYAAAFPKADMMMRRERERNMVFKKFLEDCRADPRTRRLDWNTFLKAPITRLQRYSLLLSTVLKHTITESEEKHNLELAIEEIRAVTQDCDTRVDENSKFVEMYELGNKLIMRQWPVDLRLEEKGRELIFKGDLQRTGSNRFTWLETHCILFDHYFVLAKTQMQKEIVGGAKHERYDVSRMPIPMYLLVLESTDDDPVTRTPANRLGIAGPASVNTTSRSGRYNSTSGAPMLTSTNTSSSVSSTATAPGRLVTSLPDQNGRDDKILYPFRIKHLGNPTRVLKTDDNTYTLYAPSAANRKDWCDKIILAKEKHAASLHAQNEEPFRLNIMADSAFGYESTTAAASKPIRIRGTPLDRAICEVEKRFEGQPKPPVVCRASVNCATAFTAPHGREMVAIGTDYGVFVADADNPRGWTRAVNLNKVTQIAVLEEFSLFLILADKALVAYHLDVICPAPGQPVVAASKQKSPQRLAKDVGFFATGKMKDRMLVFYKKRDGLTSTFKVLEPVLQKATEKKGRFMRKGTTEFFRDFDDFYIPADCYGINLFHSSFAVHSSKGFEVMKLEKKQAWSVPELRAGTHVDDIASRLAGEKPLGMFRLSDIEFLLCYEGCAVYVNKHGDVSRSVVMEFVGKAVAVAMFGPYVLVFDTDFVEIRNAQNGRLRQVISGNDVRCLDDAMYGGREGGRGRSVKVAMQHPEEQGRQLVVELVLNEGQKD